jgi:hypothetical protein
MSRMSGIRGAVRAAVGGATVLVAFGVGACATNDGAATPPETPITGAVPAAPEEATAAASSNQPVPKLSVEADGGVSPSAP